MLQITTPWYLSSELKSKYSLKDTELFRYMQLKNWIARNFDLGKRTSPEISNILSKSVKKKRLIGSMYNLLINVENSDTLLENIYNKWTEDLGVDVKEKGGGYGRVGWVEGRRVGRGGSE